MVNYSALTTWLVIRRRWWQLPEQVPQSQWHQRPDMLPPRVLLGRTAWPQHDSVGKPWEINDDYGLPQLKHTETPSGCCTTPGEKRRRTSKLSMNVELDQIVMIDTVFIIINPYAVSLPTMKISRVRGTILAFRRAFIEMHHCGGIAMGGTDEVPMSAAPSWEQNHQWLPGWVGWISGRWFLKQALTWNHSSEMIIHDPTKSTPFCRHEESRTVLLVTLVLRDHESSVFIKQFSTLSRCSLHRLLIIRVSNAW